MQATSSRSRFRHIDTRQPRYFDFVLHRRSRVGVVRAVGCTVHHLYKYVTAPSYTENRLGTVLTEHTGSVRTHLACRNKTLNDTLDSGVWLAGLWLGGRHTKYVMPSPRLETSRRRATALYSGLGCGILATRCCTKEDCETVGIEREGESEEEDAASTGEFASDRLGGRSGRLSRPSTGSTRTGVTCHGRELSGSGKPAAPGRRDLGMRALLIGAGERVAACSSGCNNVCSGHVPGSRGIDCTLDLACKKSLPS